MIGVHETPVIVKSMAAEVGKTGLLNVMVGTASVGLLMETLSGLNFKIFGKDCVDELDAVKLQATGLASV